MPEILQKFHSTLHLSGWAALNGELPRIRRDENRPAGRTATVARSYQENTQTKVPKFQSQWLLRDSNDAAVA
jgi:hypothetical protein